MLSTKNHKNFLVSVRKFVNLPSYCTAKHYLTFECSACDIILYIIQAMQDVEFPKTTL